MPPRAFIVAIEEYPYSTGLANALPGTHEAARQFREWLIETKAIPVTELVVCAGASCSWRTTGTTRQEILDALSRFVAAAQDNTQELYFFFSGHGFTRDEATWAIPLDILVASEFVDAATSGGACFKLQEVQKRLWSALGP